MCEQPTERQGVGLMSHDLARHGERLRHGLQHRGSLVLVSKAEGARQPERVAVVNGVELSVSGTPQRQVDSAFRHDRERASGDRMGPAEEDEAVVPDALEADIHHAVAERRVALDRLPPAGVRETLCDARPQALVAEHEDSRHARS